MLNDEIERRQQGRIDQEDEERPFDQDQTFERFDWEAPITVDQDKVKDLFSLGFAERRENVIICGPVGVGNYAKQSLM